MNKIDRCILNIGDRVAIRGKPEIKGLVVAILQTESAMEYKFVYWDDENTRKETWVYAFELIKLP